MIPAWAYTSGDSVVDKLVRLQSTIAGLRSAFKPTAIAYAATMTPNLSGSAKSFSIAITDGSAFTIANPTQANVGQRVTFILANTSAGACGTISWGAAYQLDGSFSGPAASAKRTITFEYDGTNYVEIGRTGASSGGGGGGGGASVTVGAYASLPAAGSTTGDTYRCTDSPYVFVWTGSVWQAFLRGQAVSVPGPSGGWTQTNFGGKVTVADVGGTIGLVIADAAALNWRLLTKAVPGSTPYHVEFFVRTDQQYKNSQTAGVYFTDGTKLIGLEVLTQAIGTTPFTGATLRVERMTSVTVDATTQYSKQFTTTGMQASGLWLRLGNTGTTLTFEWALERGDWQLVYSEAVGAFLTPTQYGVGGVSVQSVAGAVVVLSVQAVTVTS